MFVRKKTNLENVWWLFGKEKLVIEVFC